MWKKKKKKEKTKEKDQENKQSRQNESQAICKLSNQLDKTHRRSTLMQLSITKKRMLKSVDIGIHIIQF